MSKTDTVLQARIAAVEREASDSDYTRWELEKKIRRRDQSLKESEQRIKTLLLVEESLRLQVAALKKRVRILEEFRASVQKNVDGLKA